MPLSTLAIVTSSIIIHFASINAASAQHGIEGTISQASYTNASRCRCFPGDHCWPSISEWTAFNQSLHGELVATVPLASPCHHDIYGPFDADKCSDLQSTWFFPETHLDSSSSVMAPFFTNDSCNPFLPPGTPCALGNYVIYAVNASDVYDIQTTVKFVQERNIRLTIRNTGHDYNGKATGAGAVAVWMHHMKSMEILDHTGPTHAGKLLKMGAGIQAFEAYQYAHDRGLVIVGGNSPTVGMAGGYTQGGGHSPLSSKFGLAADQTLEWEVVTADGDYLIASPTQNADLYWALSGGGGGTFAIVVSLTVKAYPDLMNSAANLTFSSIGVSADSFWSVIETFQYSLPSLVDAGAVAIFSLTNESFVLGPLQGPGMPRAQLEHLLSPTMNQLKREGIEYSFHINEYPTFYDSYKSYDPPVNVSQYQIGGRLIPRSLVQANNSALVEAERKVLSSGMVAFISGVCVNVSVDDISLNSVNPLWRTSLFDAVIGTPFSYINASANFIYANMMTHELLPQLEALTPNGGAYINEADFQQPDFQRTLYGTNYPRLRAIKNHYDPHDMFYAITAVGSEGWYEDRTKGGRLCRVP